MIPQRATTKHHGATGLLNTTPQCTSASRASSHGSNNHQNTIPLNPERPHLITAAVGALNDTNHRIEIPVDAVIVNIIYKFTRSEHCIVIWANIETHELGMCELAVQFSTEKYGIAWVRTNEFKNLNIGDVVPAGTKLQVSPTSVHDGEYNISVNAKVALVEHLSSADDSGVISESFAKRCSRISYEKINVMIGLDQVIVGKFPSIGDKVPENRAVLVVRTINRDHAILQVCEDMNIINHLTDDVYNTHCSPTLSNSEIVEVEVIRGNTKGKRIEGCFEDVELAASVELQYMRNIRDTCEKYTREKYLSGIIVTETPELTTMLTRCNALLDPKTKISKKKDIIQRYHISITVRHTKPLLKGDKITGASVDKCVVTTILPDEEMPDGCDIVRSTKAILARMILGASHVYWESSAIDECDKQVKAIIGLDKVDKTRARKVRSCVNAFVKAGGEPYEEVLGKLYRLYMIINPVQARIFHEAMGDANMMREHLVDIGLNTVTVVTTQETQPESGRVELSENIFNSEFRPPLVHAKWKGFDGKPKTSKFPMAINYSPVYILDKTAQSASAAHTVKPNPLGVAAVTTASQQMTSSISQSNVVTMCTDGCTVLSSVLTPHQYIEIVNRAGSVETHAATVYSILTRKSKLGDYSIIDRSVPSNKISKPRALAIVSHMNECFGYTFKYEPCTYLNDFRTGKRNRSDANK